MLRKRIYSHVTRTYQQKTAETRHDWFVVDATGIRLGSLAVRIANALVGKHKPTRTPHIDDGDFVIVTNVEKVDLFPRRWTQKIYYRHSGFPGGLREETAADMLRKYPERLIERAVHGMLDDNRLRGVRLARLKLYTGAEHPHAAQSPQPLP